MKRLIASLMTIYLCGSPVFAQQAGPPPAPKQKVIQQTPFGPREVEVDAPAAPAQPPAATQPSVTPAVVATPVNPAAPPPVTGPQAAQPAPQAPQTPPSPEAAQNDQPANITLSFDNQEIYSIIRIIAETLGINYIIDPSIKGTVNLHTTGTLRRSDLLPILETILKINGATMIKTGNFYEIVPASVALRQPLPVEERSASVATDDQMVIQIVRMRFVSSGEMQRLLTPLLSEGASIVAQDSGNILLITERRSNLKKLLELVDTFDATEFGGERLRLYPVKNNFARDLIGDLKTIFAGYALSETSTAIRFVAMDRMNSVLVITPNSSVFPEVEKWLDRLDQPATNAGVRNFVYKVKNAKAVDIQKVLSELYGSRVQVSSIYQTPSGAIGASPQNAPAASSPFGGTAAVPAGPAPSIAGATGVSATAVVQNGSVRIIADETNNALVIQTTPQLYPDVQRTIEELDVLPRQVLIDAQIYSVTLDNALSLGLSAILQNRGTLTNPQTTASFVTPTGGIPSVTAQTFAFIGRTRELVGFLNASENRSKVRTLSAPSVMVSDNMQAEFTVGADVPVPTSSSITPVTSGGTNLFAQTISFRPTGVILRVKPQINPSRNVTLDISQEVSEAQANTTSGVVAPVIGKSAVTSNIVVQDGQTIAIGGFIRENNTKATARLPLLGRIPGLGVLFGNTNNETTRTELIVLITPHVLLTHEDADLATEELKNKLKEVKKLLN